MSRVRNLHDNCREFCVYKLVPSHPRKPKNAICAQNSPNLPVATDRPNERGFCVFSFLMMEEPPPQTCSAGKNMPIYPSPGPACSPPSLPPSLANVSPSPPPPRQVRFVLTAPPSARLIPLVVRISPQEMWPRKGGREGDRAEDGHWNNKQRNCMRSVRTICFNYISLNVKCNPY